jgi:hypothetical protein
MTRKLTAEYQDHGRCEKTCLLQAFSLRIDGRSKFPGRIARGWVVSGFQPASSGNLSPAPGALNPPSPPEVEGLLIKADGSETLL